MLMALSPQLEMKVHRLDMETAYLNGDLDKPLYIEIPENLKENLLKMKK